MAGVDAQNHYSNRYSCSTAKETLEWIKAISQFIKAYSFLTNARVVNFFKDRLWESLDPLWLQCLRHEPVRNLLLLPSGAVQDHWPDSLKEFVLISRSLVFPREQVELQKIFLGIEMSSLNSVLAQGMNMKKKHEIEILSAVVSSVATTVGAQTIVDVGAGQGYLAQVLSFQYQLPVVAIDSSSHHGKVTEARAERIKKHYAAQMRKSGVGNGLLKVPRTITCRVMSSEMLKTLTSHSTEHSKHPELKSQISDKEASFVLAGLHACGDLSVTMLKTFLECKEVKAIVSIGCCYNLLSEEYSDDFGSQCGFPMSSGVKSAGIALGKSSYDLACQSAERWSHLDRDAGLQNFDLHALRAAFQMVLLKYHPEVLTRSPSVGRQGKAMRRQQQKRMREFSLDNAEDERLGSTPGTNDLSHVSSCGQEGTASVDKYLLFEKFSQSSLSRLGLRPLKETELREIWKDAEHFADLIGPYWSLRAALGPVLETLLLLDRLLFLQEQGSSVESVMLPIFDPAISPRNVAIIGIKTETHYHLQQ